MEQDVPYKITDVRGAKPVEHTAKEAQTKLQLTGTLQWAALTRLDIICALRFGSSVYGSVDLLLGVLGYLKKTKNLALVYELPPGFDFTSPTHSTVYTDADFATEPHRKSISGFVCQLFGHLSTAAKSSPTTTA